ncbi:HAD family hydrolase [Reinekea sp.]|jgi:putative hydrolase of the HAD superfamily|uniref:HAD family hydrolase n=1 Tax=Reinekea sp. TaxID=1970455 RepID=UPI0039892B63
MAKNTILIDFDGVIRHWSNDELESVESNLGLDAGTLYSVAFKRDYLVPAITGKISHEQWLTNVAAKLTVMHNPEIAEQLITCWRSLKFKIDHDFLGEIKSRAPEASLVLVTNATSRLPFDLVKAKLKSAFDYVINSSDIKETKPNSGFFKKTLSIIHQPVDNTIYIDDTLANVVTAQSMGITSIHHCTTFETLTFIQSHFE